MSFIIPLSAYGKKRESIKKIKLATQDKSKKCSHSKCPNRSVITVTFGIEKRRLCQNHYNALMRKDSYFEVILKKGSEI